MAPRLRYPPPSGPEIDVGKRMRRVRTEYGLSRRLISDRVTLTEDQINRVERGNVSLRFGPGWRFCELTQTNPLWLAFGDLYPRIGFAAHPSADSQLESPDLFQDIMGNWAMGYARYRAKRFKISSEHQTAIAPVRLRKLNFLADATVKHYLATPMGAGPVMTWDNLRERLKTATSSKGARAELARVFHVSTAAVSQWLSGDSAPKADTTLRLLQWVTVAEAQHKKRAGSAETRPALTTRKGKSNK
jgi:transcriptional regulator with XRE-family HTH domain